MIELTRGMFVTFELVFREWVNQGHMTEEGYNQMVRLHSFLHDTLVAQGSKTEPAGQIEPEDSWGWTE